MCTGKLLGEAWWNATPVHIGGGGGEGEALLGVNDTDFNVWLTITFWKEQLFLLFSPIYNFVLFLGLQ